MAKAYLISIIALFALFQGKSQTFSISPNDTLYLENLTVGQQSISDIFQLNTTDSALIMAWERVNISIPADWYYVFCDWGACYPVMPESATMQELVNQGESSFLGLTLNPASEGSGMLQVNVWDVDFPENKVLCTWYFSTDLVGLRENKSIDVSIYPNPAHELLNVDVVDLEMIVAQIIDGQGRTLSTANLYHGINQISLGGIESGIYFLKLLSVSGTQIKRFCVQ